MFKICHDIIIRIFDALNDIKQRQLANAPPNKEKNAEVQMALCLSVYMIIGKDITRIEDMGARTHSVLRIWQDF